MTFYSACIVTSHADHSKLVVLNNAIVILQVSGCDQYLTFISTNLTVTGNLALKYQVPIDSGIFGFQAEVEWKGEDCCIVKSWESGIRAFVYYEIIQLLRLESVSC